MGGPIAAGLALTMAPAFGYLPALGGRSFGLDPWRALIAEPGVIGDVRLTVVVGFAATSLALTLAFSLLAATAGRPRRFPALLAALLATPHSAMAIGLAFLIAPSGWLMRLFSPWATGFATPPDLAIVNDRFGLSLVLGLALKETPFLLAASVAALNQLPATDHLRVARALGYRPAAAWLLALAPQVYQQIRLPIYAVLAYSLSVVDMAIVLAPTRPTPLSLLSLHWLLAQDLDLIFPGAAAATLQLTIVVIAIGLWRLGEFGPAATLRRRAAWGARGAAVEAVLAALAAFARLVLALGAAALVALAVWSFAWRWPYPAALPESWSLEIWRREGPQLVLPLLNTLALAVISSFASLALAVAWLEADDRAKRRTGMAAIYLPLLAPQLAFLFGVQTLFAWTRIDGTFGAVAWAHTLFVFPYVMLALADPWRALDARYARAASALGASRWRALWRVKLPILMRPISLALAIGISASVAQYLATLFADGGRIATLTTEAIGRASGGDRRVAAVAAFLQAGVPLVAFAGAFLTPRRSSGATA